MDERCARAVAHGVLDDSLLPEDDANTFIRLRDEYKRAVIPLNETFASKPTLASRRGANLRRVVRPSRITVLLDSRPR